MLFFVKSEVVLLLDALLLGFLQLLYELTIISQNGINSLRLESISHPSNATQVLNDFILRLLASPYNLWFWLFLSSGWTKMMGIFPV